MTVFRGILVAFLLAITAYTLAVGLEHGWELFSVFFGDLVDLTWSGQFNLDFTLYLLLSAGWVAWRHEFSPVGIALALVASVAGMIFLAAYLLYESFRVQGDVVALLLGPSRASGLR